MAESIDYSFISALEGGSRTTGYVPASDVSKSGVTIATGFDLGQRNSNDLESLGLSATLIKKLSPYLESKGSEAEAVIESNPLIITEDEASSIDKAVKSSHIATLKVKYNAAQKVKSFTELPAEAQTVIASVSFQYGVGLSVATPKFWAAVTSQDWEKAKKLLNSFGDAYPTRRKKEAKLLGKIK